MVRIDGFWLFHRRLIRVVGRLLVASGGKLCGVHEVVCGLIVNYNCVC